MKLAPRDQNSFFAKPPSDCRAVLIYGADAMRVALKREALLKALLGENAETEMRLMRHSASELRKDPALLQDGLKAKGFFDGPRAVFIEDATETVAKIIIDSLGAWTTGDATIVITAGALKPTSSLRKTFEGHKSAYAVAIYDNPPTRAEIEAELAQAGLQNLPSDAMAYLADLAKILEPGDFRQTLQKIALYKFQDTAPLSAQDIAACAPISNEADLDDLIQVVAEGKPAEIGPTMSRLQSQGVQPVTLVIGLTRHFRTLFTVACDSGGVANGIGKLRPPVFGPRRDQVQRQAGNWGAKKLQHALGILTDLDLQLRSANQTAPAMGIVERAIIRMAMLAKR